MSIEISFTVTVFCKLKSKEVGVGHRGKESEKGNILGNVCDTNLAHGQGKKFYILHCLHILFKLNHC